MNKASNTMLRRGVMSSPASMRYTSSSIGVSVECDFDGLSLLSD